jgi:hypothetical protein
VSALALQNVPRRAVKEYLCFVEASGEQGGKMNNELLLPIVVVLVVLLIGYILLAPRRRRHQAIHHHTKRRVVKNLLKRVDHGASPLSMGISAARSGQGWRMHIYCGSRRVVYVGIEAGMCRYIMSSRSTCTQI